MLLKISHNSQKKTCVALFFNKVARLKLATLLKKRLRHRCLPVSFEEFLRTPPVDAFEFAILLNYFVHLMTKNTPP